MKFYPFSTRKRPIVLFLIIGGLFLLLPTTETIAQMKIYELAKGLEKALDEQPQPMVSLSESSSTLPIYQAPSAATYGKDSVLYGRLISGYARPLPLIPQGLYKIHEAPADDFTAKELEVYYGLDTFTVNANLLDTILIDYQPNYLRVYTQSDSLVKDTLLHNQSFVNAYALLGTYIPGLAENPERSNFFELRDAFLPFEENPFIGGLLTDDRFSSLPYPSDQTEATIKAILALMDSTVHQYTRQIVPVDSESAAADALSIQAIEVSYRSPISTSTSALKEVTQRVSVNQKAAPTSFDADAIITGLSDFVVERAEEEFNIAFMERFREKLMSKQYKELRILFPATTRFFTEQLDIIQYKTLLPLAKQAFVHDMENLGVNFANMLEQDDFKKLENEPNIYNIALFYEIASLAYQGVSIDTILQNTYQRLDKRQVDLFRKSNLRLAKNPNARATINQLDVGVSNLTGSLDTLSRRIDSLLFKLETDFFVLQNLADSTGQGARVGRMYQRYYERSSRQADRFYQWRGREKVDQLERISYNLEGTRDYKRLLENQPQIDKYPIYFSNPPDSVQLVAAGIDLSRKLATEQDRRKNIVDFLIDFSDFLQDTEIAVANLTATLKASTQSALEWNIQQFEKKKNNLKDSLDAEISFWKRKAPGKYKEQIGALEYLSSALEPANDPSWIIEADSSNARQQLHDARKKYHTALTYVSNQLDALDTLSRTKSSLLTQVKREMQRPLIVIDTTNITDSLATLIDQEVAVVNSVLFKLDTTYNGQLLRAERNAAFFKKIVELAANLLYCLEAPTQYDSLGNVKDTTRWLTRDQFRSILKTPESRDLYLGLIYNQLNDVAGTANLSSEGVATITTNFIDIINEAVIYRDSLELNKKNEKLKFVDYFPFVRLSMDLLNTLITTPLVDEKPLFPGLKEVPIITDQALSLFENIYNDQYSYAIYNAVELYKTITSDLAGDTTHAGEIRDNIILYGSFIANVAAAKSAEDMKGALVAAALPPGSSRIKRQNRTNVSINAYMGLGAGGEQINDNVAGLANDWGFLAALSVPIGLSYSIRPKIDSKLSYTFFVPILDLGGVTSFRIDNNENTSSLPELSFQNVIAPGGYLLANINNSPFSLGAGVQYGPQLRTVMDSNGVELEASAWRAMFLFAVDVPVFNLFTRKEKRR